MNKTKHYALALMISLLILSCDNSSTENRNKEVASTYAVAIGGDPDVLRTVETIKSGEISPKNAGFEFIGWRSFEFANNTIFSIGYSSDTQCIGFEKKEGKIVEKGRFTFDATLDVFGVADNSTVLAMQVPRAGFEKRVFHVINSETMKVTKKVEHELYQNKQDSLVSWPTSLVVRGDKLFVSYYVLHANGSFATPNSDQARVAVYNYPSLTFDKYITDDRTSDIGVYSSSNGLVKSEKGDIYSFSSSALAGGFSPTPTKPSGFLKIPNGTNDFDTSYFFNFQSAMKGYKLYSVRYLGNNKALVRMITEDKALWGAFKFNTTDPKCKLAIVDLEAKTVKEVSGVPLHGGQYDMPALVDGDKVYVNISDANAVHIYEIDIPTATGTQGASVQGEVKGIYKL